MHSQLATVTVGYAMGVAEQAKAVQQIVTANVSTQCACFSDTLSPNAHMHEILAALDIIPHVVKLIVEEMNMESLAILYGSVFGGIEFKYN